MFSERSSEFLWQMIPGQSLNITLYGKLIYAVRDVYNAIHLAINTAIAPQEKGECTGGAVITE